MEKIIVDNNQISEYLRLMTNHLNNLMDVIQEMNNMQSEVIWDSENRDKFFIIYNDAINSYFSFLDRMIKYLEYLNGFIDSYDSSLNEIKRNFRNLGNEFNKEVS